jgi:hypothetical protein
MRLGADPWTGNRYAFAGGNPISAVERDGHCWDVFQDVCDAAAAAADWAGDTGNEFTDSAGQTWDEFADWAEETKDDVVEISVWSRSRSGQAPTL